MTTRFDWDQGKNQRNRTKHGVTFETAALVFQDRNLMTRRDRVVEQEQRWHTIGYAKGILTVVRTLIEADGDEVIRIISARRTTPGEKRLYEKEEID